jgi:hypothetical protein
MSSVVESSLTITVVSALAGQMTTVLSDSFDSSQKLFFTFFEQNGITDELEMFLIGTALTTIGLVYFS